MVAATWLALLCQGDQFFDALQGDLCASLCQDRCRSIGSVQRNAQPDVFAKENVDEAFSAWQRAKPNHLEGAAEQGMCGIHDLDQVVFNESGRIDRGINMGPLAGQ